LGVDWNNECEVSGLSNEEKGSNLSGYIVRWRIVWGRQARSKQGKQIPTRTPVYVVRQAERCCGAVHDDGRDTIGRDGRAMRTSGM